LIIIISDIIMYAVLAVKKIGAGDHISSQIDIECNSKTKPLLTKPLLFVI